MVDFDHQTLQHLKKLCRIDCTEEEEAEVTDSLKRVISYITLLNEVDTEGVASCNFVLRSMLKNRMRDDIPEPPLTREEFLANVPDQIGGMVRVPPVLKPPQ